MYTFVFGDIHGKPESLRRLLRAARIINGDDDRLPVVMVANADVDYQLVSIGDLANAVLKDVNGDFECLKLAGRWNVTCVLGNHEAGYLYPEMTFNGFYPSPEVKSSYRALMFNGQIVPAVLVGETLLTHAGVCDALQWTDASDAFYAIMNAWENYSRLTEKDVLHFHDYEIPKDMIFTAVHKKRQGSAPFGGILWSDWSEPKNFHFSQVVGHTPMPEGPIRIDYMTNQTFTLNIDTGSKSGYAPWGVWLDENGEIVSFVTATEED